MGKFFDHIPANIISWIQEQKLFFVATAPLIEDGHVNLSPKGCCEETFHVVVDDNGEGEGESKSEDQDPTNASSKKTSRAVWYEDMTGSGVETISHLRENGRVTVMFVAFEGPPQIVRLFGTGKVYEFGTPEYEELVPLNKRQPGSRAVIWIDVHKVGTSCGFSIPFFDYNRPRHKLHRLSAPLEQKDYDYYAACASSSADDKKDKPEEPQGLKLIWKSWNAKSLDGLPGLELAYSSSTPLNDWKSTGREWPVDDESVKSKNDVNRMGGDAASRNKRVISLVSTQQGLGYDLAKLLVGFGAGLVFSAAVGRLMRF